MHYAARGIVLHTLKYAETSVIARVYTDRFGMQSYLIKGVRSSRSVLRPALFQPGTMLDMVVTRREKQTLHAVKEARLETPYTTLHTDIRKSSVALYMNELVYRAVREETPDPGLFRFLRESLLALDTTEGSVADFPLCFSMQLMQFLGILPRTDPVHPEEWFDLREGHFTPGPPSHPDCLDPPTGQTWAAYLSLRTPQEWVKGFDGSAFRSPVSRRQMLETLLLYYRLHLPGFSGTRSHRILHDVLA